MADKGFDIRYELMLVGAKLGSTLKCPVKDMVQTRQIASLRTHVERVIRRYRILGAVMPLTMVRLSNEIWDVCSLFHPPLVMDHCLNLTNSLYHVLHANGKTVSQAGPAIECQLSQATPAECCTTGL